MKKRRLALGALTVAACSPAPSMTDAGVDAGYDAGRDAGTDAGYDAGYDAGRPDAGRSDGGSADAGCRCYRDDGGCPVPPDFPPDAAGTFYEEELCYCTPNDRVFCADETTLRCEFWGCNVGKLPDAGVELTEDGGLQCYC